MSNETSKTWVCVVCGYVHTGPNPPDVCPVCGAGPDDFELETGKVEPSTSDQPHDLTISDVIAETLVNCGIKHAFGMVGHSNLGMAEAFRKQEEKGNLRFIDIRHEGAAAFACSAYAKLTGTPAVCFTIAGPGATNLLTGLYDAKVDRAPVLALTGQVDTQVLGPGAFQEVNLTGVFNDVSCFNHTVLESSQPAELATLAVKNAIVKRDVANLILPNEIQNLPAPADAAPGSLRGRVGSQFIAPSDEQIAEATQALQQAKRPVIIVGHGAKAHVERIVQLAETMTAPILTTFKAKGLIADNHPLACGVLGRSGTPVSRWFMDRADLLMVIGATFSKHTGITTEKKTIQIDYDAMALGKFHPIDIPIWGEIGITVDRLNQSVSQCPERQEILDEVAAKWHEWRSEKQKRRDQDLGKGISSAAVFEAMSRAVQRDAVISVDVGNNAYSFGRYFECADRQSVLMSGYLGAIGFGYPAAIGAWAATEGKRPVWCVTGDGGFAQYMGELLTAVKYKMNITHVLLHNDQLAKIAVEQEAGQYPIWKTDQHNPDFSHYADICGAKGVRIEKSQDLDEGFRAARDHEGPALVEVMCDPALT